MQARREAPSDNEQGRGAGKHSGEDEAWPLTEAREVGEVEMDTGRAAPGRVIRRLTPRQGSKDGGEET